MNQPKDQSVDDELSDLIIQAIRAFDNSRTFYPSHISESSALERLYLKLKHREKVATIKAQIDFIEKYRGNALGGGKAGIVLSYGATETILKTLQAKLKTEEKLDE